MERIQAAIQKAKEQRSTGGGPVAGMAARRVAPQPAAPDVGAAWEALERFVPAPALMRRNRIVTFDRSDVAHLTFDMVRTKILKQMRENGWSSLAVTSPSAGCGKTTLMLNLAFSFARQQNLRTVLMDIDLRRPAIAQTLGLKRDQSMAAFLQGSGELAEHFVRYDQGLAIGTSLRPAANPAEILHHPAAGQALAGLRRALEPDVLLFDMPPMMSCDDVLAFQSHYDCVLLLAAAEISTPEEVDRCERELAEQTNLLGVILNKCRYMPDRYGYYY